MAFNEQIFSFVLQMFSFCLCVKQEELLETI